MRNRDRDRGLDAAYARLVDRTDQVVETPDVATIHRRVDLRSVRGIGLTFAATSVAGLLLGAVVLGIGGIGMGPDSGRSAGHRAAPSYRAAGPATTPRVPLTAPQGTARPPGSPRAATPTAPVRTAHAAPPTVSRTTSRPTPSPTRSDPPPWSTPSPSAPPSAPPTSRLTPSRVPSPSPSSAMNATAVPRAPLRIWVGYKSGQLDDRGCRRTRRVARTVVAPTPEAVVATVLAGPSPAERDDGVHTLYGRSGRPTPARVEADWSKRVLIVDYPAPDPIAYAPADCRGPEIRWPVVDALRQSHPGWTVRFTLQGSAERFTDYVNGD